MGTQKDEIAERFGQHHYTVGELAAMRNLSTEFVRQIVQSEPGVTEWVRQQPGRRRYRVLRVPQSVVERVYRPGANNGAARSLLPVAPLLRSRSRVTLTVIRKSLRRWELDTVRPIASVGKPPA
jgi:hypothetical protein